MVYADIFNQMSLSGVSSTTTGSSYDVSRLTRKSVFVSAITDGSGTATGSQIFVLVEASPDNSSWYTLDTKRYESGTATQNDIFSYNSHFPYMRTQVIGSNVNTFSVDTTITGRGV
ncbi:MAG: hypothetical protein ACTSUC_09820 [Promethearchaeota archaeon]